MNLDLDKEGLITLAMGSSPNYNVFENPKVDQSGRFNGSTGVWHWDRTALEKLTESELHDLYITCRESWE